MVAIRVFTIILSVLIGIFIGREIGQLEFIIKLTTCSKDDFVKIFESFVKQRIIIEKEEDKE